MFPSQSPTDTEVENLINFIRGVDTYDQDGDNNKTESIHKLADIYHSDLIIVGKPEAPATDDGSLILKRKIHIIDYKITIIISKMEQLVVDLV